MMRIITHTQSNIKLQGEINRITISYKYVDKNKLLILCWQFHYDAEIKFKDEKVI